MCYREDGRHPACIVPVAAQCLAPWHGNSAGGQCRCTRSCRGGWVCSGGARRGPPLPPPWCLSGCTVEVFHVCSRHVRACSSMLNTAAVSCMCSQCLKSVLRCWLFWMWGLDWGAFVLWGPEHEGACTENTCTACVHAGTSAPCAARGRNRRGEGRRGLQGALLCLPVAGYSPSACGG